MKNLMTAMALGVTLCCGSAFAASHAGAPMKAGGTCDAQAAEKKLAGAAKTSFVKKCEKDAKAPAAAASPACEKSAADKKLAGAAKNSFMKKCDKEAAAAGAGATSLRMFATGRTWPRAFSRSRSR
mgnify:CR=1 FL=1